MDENKELKEAREKRIAELTRKCNSMTSVVLGLLNESEKAKDKDKFHKKDPKKNSREIHDRTKEKEKKPPQNPISSKDHADVGSNSQLESSNANEETSTPSAKNQTQEKFQKTILPQEKERQSPAIFRPSGNLKSWETEKNQVCKVSSLMPSDDDQGTMRSPTDRIPKKDRKMSASDFGAGNTSEALTLSTSKAKPVLSLEKEPALPAECYSNIQGVVWNRERSEWEVHYYDAESNKKKMRFPVGSKRSMEEAKKAAEDTKKRLVRVNVKNQIVLNSVTPPDHQSKNLLPGSKPLEKSFPMTPAQTLPIAKEKQSLNENLSISSENTTKSERKEQNHAEPTTAHNVTESSKESLPAFERTKEVAVPTPLVSKTSKPIHTPAKEETPAAKLEQDNTASALPLPLFPEAPLNEEVEATASHAREDNSTVELLSKEKHTRCPEGKNTVSPKVIRETGTTIVTERNENLKPVSTPIQESPTTIIPKIEENRIAVPEPIGESSSTIVPEVNENLKVVPSQENELLIIPPPSPAEKMPSECAASQESVPLSEVNTEAVPAPPEVNINAVPAVQASTVVISGPLLPDEDLKQTIQASPPATTNTELLQMSAEDTEAELLLPDVYGMEDSSIEMLQYYESNVDSDQLSEGFTVTPGERAKQRAQEREEARRKVEETSSTSKCKSVFRPASMVVGAPFHRMLQRLALRSIKEEDSGKHNLEKTTDISNELQPMKSNAKDQDETETEKEDNSGEESEHESNSFTMSTKRIKGPLKTSKAKNPTTEKARTRQLLELRRKAQQLARQGRTLRQRKPDSKVFPNQTNNADPTKSDGVKTPKPTPKNPRIMKGKQTAQSKGNSHPKICLSKNNDLCATCGEGGDLLCCDSCPRAFHLKCVRSLKGRVPRGSWFCTACSQESKKRKKRSLGGDEADVSEASCLNGEITLHQIFAENQDTKSGVSILCLLMYLELVLQDADFLKILQYAVQVGRHLKLDEPTDIMSDRMEQGQLNISMLALLRYISSIVGSAQLVQLLKQLKTTLRPIATGFGMNPNFLEESRCWNCAGLRLLRTACFCCGSPFNLNEHVALQSKNFKAGSNLRRLHEKIADQLDNGGQQEDAKAPSNITATLLSPSPKSSLDGKSTVEDAYEQMRRSSIIRAIDYVHQCSQNDDDFRGYGGDMLFLLRNVTTMAVGEVKDHTRRLLHEVAKRWMEFHPHMAEDAEADLILTCIEGMHALMQLGYSEDKSKALPELVMPPEQASSPHKKSRRGNASKECKGSENVEDGSQGMPEDESPTPTEEETEGDSGERSIAQGRKRRKSRMDNQANGFKFETFREELHKALMRFDITDIVGFNPADGKIPFTPTEHCGHCGKTNTRGTKQCVDCGAYLKSKIDYGSLTDAVVWSYLFYEIGLSFDCHSGNISFTEVVKLLPEARCYKSVDEMGHDFFKLQCYFLTHFIYVCSNWGQHALRRHLFAEEFEFVLANIKQVIRMDDPELVGEFVQCLRILQVTEERDPEIWPLVQQCMAYLIETERKRGSKGLFSSTTCPLYTRYHASYCGAVGLIDYAYLEPGAPQDIPLSSCFMYDNCRLPS